RARRIPPRSEPATRGDSSARVAGPGARHGRASLSRELRVAGESAEPDVGDAALGGEVSFEGAGTCRGDPVGAPTIIALHGFDQPLALESAQCLVERARRNAHTGKALDVFRERVAMLWAVG